MNQIISTTSTNDIQQHTDKAQRAIQTPTELSDKYTFIQKIGQGAQADVYLAQRNSDAMFVAIKHLNIDSVQNWKEYDLFHREAEVLKNLSIDGVARFYEAPEFLNISHPAAYIVQEYIDGLSLETLIKDGYRFTLQKLFKFILQLLEILNQLHTHEPPIIHRDLKPGNIMMKMLPNGEYKPYLIDFGAVANPQVQSGGSTVAGTYGFMPPEQLMGKPVPASDIYSLAAMITYLLSGVSPGNMQVTDFHLIIEPHLENIPNIITATLHQMLEPTVEKRLVDYTSLRERFEMFAAGKFEMTLGATEKLDEKKLLTVQKLGQRGNVDLWMSLSDQTPRELPKHYKNLIPAIDIERKSIYPILKKNYIKQSIRSIFTNKNTYIVTIIVIIFCLIMYAISLTEPKAIIGVFIFAGIGIIVLAGTILDIISLYRQKIKSLPTNKHRWNANLNSPKDKDNINTILKYGSKTIATIIDCCYEPSHQSDIEVYEQFLTYENLRGYLHTYPRFKLRYKFNPPDDDNPDELVHEIYIHRDMHDLLQPGDPLPILYYINPDNNLDVMSMPFPYPLNDIAAFSEMYYKSQNDVIKANI